MKMYLNLLLSGALGLHLLIAPLFAQCNIEPLAEKGIKNLGNGYTFLKTYPVSGSEGKKYSYIFSQGTHYVIHLSNSSNNSSGVYINMYDSNHRKIASSYNPETNTFYPAISFDCQRTGIYQLEFKFIHTKDYCAAGVLGMKR
ncbi:MAG: hypothetical protein OHK0053_10240 [Microscillaceae bacterium]